MSAVLLFLIFSVTYTLGCPNRPFFEDAGPLVKTNTGSVIGTYVKVFDMDVAAFLGIPFAKPPIGIRRFRKPEPLEPWKGKLFATKKPPPCMQYSSKNFSFIATTKPSENCLYLNVWTPKERHCGANELFPVLVWIHGGAFVFGSTDIELYDGSVIATHGEAVVVSMNYRLGSFGFLNFGIEDAPGNMGLHDQMLAMKWVKENIHYFGGDPDKITLFGESAGAISASLHLISPLSKNLFNRVILESGTAYHPSYTDSPAVAGMRSKIFADLVNCSNDSGETDLVVTCLKKMDAMTLAQTEASLTSKSVMFFGPSYGNDFLPKSSIDAYESGDFAQMDVLMGCNRDEGSLFLNFLLPDTFPSHGTPNLTKTLLNPIVSGIFQILPERALTEIMNFYFKSISEEDSEGIAKSLAAAIGDFFFYCPHFNLAKKLKNVYVYYMTHRSSKDESAKWMGVPHFYDVPFVFGKPIMDIKHYSPEDGRFSGEMIQKWVSFADKGYPSDEKQWPKFTSKNLMTYELNPKESRHIVYPHKDVCEFWTKLTQQS